MVISDRRRPLWWLTDSVANSPTAIKYMWISSQPPPVSGLRHCFRCPSAIPSSCFYYLLINLPFRLFVFQVSLHRLFSCIAQQMPLLQILDPIGIDQRKRRRLRRRQYKGVEPNSTWHIDGYDKLKPYGICVNGCIGGFSRNSIWLEANCTNNDPKVIAEYMMEAVVNHGCAHDGCVQTGGLKTSLWNTCKYS